LIERRILNLAACPIALEKRTSADGKEKQVFTGYAAVFFDAGDPGTEYPLYPGMRERVMPTCFDRAIREGQDIRGLLNHEPDNLLGRCSSGTMRVSVDKRGLRYEIDYDPDDADHQRVMAKMKRGDLTGSSFSFRVAPNGQKFSPGGPDADDIRELHDVDVLDVGPVTFPAYSSTTSGTRAAGEEAELRSLCQDAQALQRGAVKYAEGPAIREDKWDQDAALERVQRWAHEGDRMNFQKYSRAFGHHDGSATEAGFRLLHHDVRDGKLHVHEGAVARCLRLLDSEGGGGVPEADRAACRSHLERHQSAWQDDEEDEDLEGEGEGDADRDEEDGDDERKRTLEQKRMRLRLADAEA
jgi:HK97 family phage prohead protease